MSEPLELKVYPKDPSYEPSDSFTVYLLGNGKKECAGTSCALPSRKRFTDSELAAEHYRAAFYHESEVADNDGYDGSLAARAYYRQSRVFHRFATHPHHDEEAA